MQSIQQMTSQIADQVYIQANNSECICKQSSYSHYTQNVTDSLPISIFGYAVAGPVGVVCVIPLHLVINEYFAKSRCPEHNEGRTNGEVTYQLAKHAATLTALKAIEYSTGGAGFYITDYVCKIMAPNLAYDAAVNLITKCGGSKVIGLPTAIASSAFLPVVKSITGYLTGR